MIGTSTFRVCAKATGLSMSLHCLMWAGTYWVLTQLCFQRTHVESLYIVYTIKLWFAHIQFAQTAMFWKCMYTYWKSVHSLCNQLWFGSTHWVSSRWLWFRCTYMRVCWHIHTVLRVCPDNCFFFFDRHKEVCPDNCLFFDRHKWVCTDNCILDIHIQRVYRDKNVL